MCAHLASVSPDYLCFVLSLAKLRLCALPFTEQMISSPSALHPCSIEIVAIKCIQRVNAFRLIMSTLARAAVVSDGDLSRSQQ